MKKILIDLEKCYTCKKCDAKCSYYYHDNNTGVERLLALASQRLVCRRCKESFCVAACPNKALEKREDGMVDRYSFRCTSCKTCSIACPFGTIYPEIVTHKTSGCDLCVNRSDDNTVPLCVQSCPNNALTWVEVEENAEQDVYLVKDKVAVKTLRWEKESRKNDKHYT
ncbi:MAG: 4Fe-4S dicluster domain-containing protein [Elusimicrobiota bacterium]